jgi:integral membrane protein
VVELEADRLRAVVVRAYRVMAYVTGTMLIVLCFVGIPLQVFAGSDAVVKVVGAAHGFLYIVYLVVAFTMTRLVGIRTASLTTVIVLAAGTIPVLTFVVERWVTGRYIAPALAADQAGTATTAAASDRVLGVAPPGQRSQ